MRLDGTTSWWFRAGNGICRVTRLFGGDGALEIGGRIMVLGLDRKGIGERTRIPGEHRAVDEWKSGMMIL